MLSESHDFYNLNIGRYCQKIIISQNMYNCIHIFKEEITLNLELVHYDNKSTKSLCFGVN